MAGSKRNTAVLESGELIDTDTGEILSHNNPEPEPNETELAARDLANRDAEADPEMLDLLSHVAVAWMPEVGDKLIGEVVGRFTRTDGRWGPYEVIEIQTASGAVIAWHAFGTVGQSSVARRNPQPGDRIGITCLTPIETDKGNPYRNYQIIVRKPVRDGTMAPTGNSGGENQDWNRPA